MSLYYDWLIKNLRNPEKFHYQKWDDNSNTYIIGAYDKVTGKGIERKFVLESEYEIDKSEEIKNDVYKYQE
jgi:hypothetical protein